jgi:hypothetical protein
VRLPWLLQVVSWFGTLGFAMPYGVNVADFLLDLAQGEVEGGDFSRLTAAAAAGQQLYKQQQAPQLTAAGENGADSQQRHMGAAHGVPAAPLAGPAAVQALYSSYETYKRKHPGGFGGEPGQVADLQLALEPPLSKKAAAAAAGSDSKRRLGSVSSGSFMERSLQKAGSFLGLADMADKAGAESPKQHGKSAAVAGDSDELSDPVDDEEDEVPEYKRSITRIWSRGHSSSNLFSAGPGDVEAGSADSGKGCAGQLVGSMGLADRGGASYSTQLRVLLQRHIKVRGHGCSGGAVVRPGGACWRLPLTSCAASCWLRAVMSCMPPAAPHGVQFDAYQKLYSHLLLLLLLLVQVKRFESLSSQRFLQGIIVALITGMFWWQRGTGGSLLAASDVVGLLFFELLFPAFTALFTSLFTFPNDYRMLLKERASGM